MYKKVISSLMLTLFCSMLLMNIAYGQDVTPPTGSIVINAGAVYTSSEAVTLTLTYADNESGVDAVRYTNNHDWGSEPWETPVATKSWNLTSGDGAKYVSYQIRDNAGRIGNFWDSIVLDTVAPTGSILINDGESSTTSQLVTLKLTYQDAGAGVDKVRFTNKNVWSTETWETPAETKQWNLTSGSGLKYVSYQIRDYSGKISASLWDTITFVVPMVAAPTFSPAGGNYSSSQNVTLRCSTESAIITYTLDGSEPSSTSTTYSVPITVGTSTVIKAKAFKEGMTDSEIATATYNINIPPSVLAPTFSPVGGVYSSAQNVTVRCATSGAIIRYTVDGSEPSSASTVYSDPVEVNSTTMIKAKAFKDGMTDSPTATATYNINIPEKVATPTFFPGSGTYTSAQNVVISCSTADVIITYSLDGSEPSMSSTVYSGPIGVSSTTMIKAKAFREGLIDSATSTATYTIVTPTPGPGISIPQEVLYAAIIIVVAAIVGVVVLLLRKSKSKSPQGYSTTKPKLYKR